MLSHASTVDNESESCTRPGMKAFSDGMHRVVEEEAHLPRNKKSVQSFSLTAV